ncbi:MAG: PTS sugar transporter subunit IIB [Spirochaetia bacterium]
MGTPDIKLARVDNRMIHGQVAVMWTSACRANIIIVVDDDVVNQQSQMQLMAMAAPDGVQTRFFTVQKMIDVAEKASASQHIFLVTRTPIAMAQLVKAGIGIPEVNLGNMHDGAGKKAIISEFLYATDEEILAIKELCNAGVRVYGQMTPTRTVHEINPIIEKF